MLNRIKNLLFYKQDKSAIVLRNTICAFGIKGLALLISLFTMPAYMAFFSDKEVLGVWFTVLSVFTWILNFDLGIGNGLRNKLAASIAVNDKKASKEYVSSAYWIICSLVLIISIVGFILIPFANWNAVFNVEPSLITKETMIEVVRLVFLGIMLQFALRLVSSLLYALQKSAVNNFISLVTSLLQLLFALFAPSFTPAENLVMFSCAFIITANLPLVIATIFVFAGPLRFCLPRRKFVSRERAKQVLSLGGIFFLCQVLYMIIANTNEFFVSQYTSSEFVVDYQVYYRVFSLGSTLYMLALTPLWSAVSRAVAENDFSWLKQINKKISKLSLIAIAFEFLLVPLSQFIIDIWLQEEAIQINYGYALCFATFGAAMIYQSGVSTIVCGTGRMKLQAICYAIGVLLKFIIIHIGVAWTNEWITVVIANAVILIPYCVLQQISLNRFFRNNEKPGFI